MPRIEFNDVRKDFGAVEVIKSFNADIDDNEFLVLLGPSGCGKSTMLRMIAGLTPVTSGDISFDGEVVNQLEPRQRNVAFVFQTYALYPQMTVRDNIAFPLIMDQFRAWHEIPIINMIARRRFARRPDVREKVAEVARMLELDEYLERKPKALSGGQRQRVALARALVREPSIYLLDEPLSNLDAKLRSAMRAEISALYRRVGRTFVYVTHDQVEAMTMATRIIVLKDGVIQQIGTPDDIYDEPANVFVARFIGAPPMNLLPVDVRDGSMCLTQSGAPLHGFEAVGDGSWHLGIRPEKLSLEETSATTASIPGWVRSVEHLGGETIVGFGLVPHDPDALLSIDDSHHAKLQGKVRLTVGERLVFHVDPHRHNWFDVKTGMAVNPRTAELPRGDG